MKRDEAAAESRLEHVRQHEHGSLQSLARVQMGWRQGVEEGEQLGAFGAARLEAEDLQHPQGRIEHDPELAHLHLRAGDRIARQGAVGPGHMAIEIPEMADTGQVLPDPARIAVRRIDGNTEEAGTFIVEHVPAAASAAAPPGVAPDTWKQSTT